MVESKVDFRQFCFVNGITKFGSLCCSWKGFCLSISKENQPCRLDRSVIGEEFRELDRLVGYFYRGVSSVQKLGSKERIRLKVDTEFAKLSLLEHLPSRVLKIYFDILRAERWVKLVSYNWSCEIKLQFGKDFVPVGSK